MKALAAVLAVTATALVLLAAVVFGLRDGRVMVSPPDAVAEGFMRKLGTGRSGLAVDHLSRGQTRRMSADRLRSAAEEYQARAGRIIDVRGEPGEIQGDRADAAAELMLEGGRPARVRFGFTRENGVWKIDDLSDLTGDDRSASQARGARP